MDMSAPAPRPAVLLVGFGPTTLTALRALAGPCRVTGLVRRELDEAAALALTLGIPLLPARSPAEIARLDAFAACDCVVVSSYDRVIPAAILALKPHLNVHYAPLPRYRGRANVNWAILNGEPEAAVTVHAVAPGLDDGPILHQESVSIEPDDTAASLYDRLNAVQERALAGAVLRFLAGDPGRPQDERLATYGCARLDRDGEIDWSAPTARIERLVRALSPPFPGAFTHLDARRLVVRRAVPRPDPPVYAGRVPGRVAARSADEGWVDVLTGDGVLRLLEISIGDGPPVPAATEIRSTRATLGLSTAALLARIEALEAALARLARERAREPAGDRVRAPAGDAPASSAPA